MRSPLIVLVAASLAAGIVGCSSSTKPVRQAGTLPGGTAKATVNGADVGTVDSVTCRSDEFFTTITTGNDDAGTTSVVNNQTGLDVKSVSVRNLGGFSGTFLKDLQGSAKATQTGTTYVVTGEAAGYAADKPNVLANAPFRIEVAC